LTAVLAAAVLLAVIARSQNRQAYLRDDVRRWIGDAHVLSPGNTVVTIQDRAETLLDELRGDRPAYHRPIDQAQNIAEQLGLRGAQGVRTGQPVRFVRVRFELSDVTRVQGDWSHPTAAATAAADYVTLEFPSKSHGPPARLTVWYQPMSGDLSTLERYNAIFWAAIVYVGISLSGMAFMAALSRRDAVASALLVVADRLCHELNNVNWGLGLDVIQFGAHLHVMEKAMMCRNEACHEALRAAGLSPEVVADIEAKLARRLEDQQVDDATLRESITQAGTTFRDLRDRSVYFAMIVAELRRSLARQPMRPQFEVVDPRGLYERAARLLGSKKLGSARVVFEGPAGPVSVWADESLLLRVVINLMKNVVEAAGDHRPLTLTLGWRRQGNEVVLRVADNGPGLAPRALHRLRRGRIGGFTTKGPGRGRGLAIVADAVRAMRGSLEADNRPGGGAEFRVRLPAAGAHPIA
jgi:signal transduction histidine kinase